MSRARDARPDPAAADYDIRVVGAPTPLRDFYYVLMRLSWPATLLVIAGSYLAANALFACGYLWLGGVEHARAGSYADAFYFSVQTMGTIGYGTLSPRSHGANLLVVAQSVTSLVLTALATGLVFAKFSRPNARVSSQGRCRVGTRRSASS